MSVRLNQNTIEMSDQFDLFAGTEHEAQKPKVKIKTVIKTDWTDKEEVMVLTFAKKWENSFARHFLENDILKYKDGRQLMPEVLIQYRDLIHSVMRGKHINAKHFEVEGYGTTKLGIVKHEGAQCLKFNHRETGESIYINLQRY